MRRACPCKLDPIPAAAEQRKSEIKVLSLEAEISVLQKRKTCREMTKKKNIINNNR